MEHDHHEKEDVVSRPQMCELCGMVAEHQIKDEHGVTHHYCSHHMPAQKQEARIKNQEKTPAHHSGNHAAASHNKHEGHTPNMFRDRFWLSLVLTVPVVLYSPMVQEILGFSMPEFNGSRWIPAVFGSVIFFYGGIVFIKSALAEIKAKVPGMMTLISLAILAAYIYSIATTFFIEGTEFFWELATLITIMLLGHWMEMKSVSSAQGALKELAKLLPDTAERIKRQESGSKAEIEHVSVSELKVGNMILVRPGGKIPADGKVVEGDSSVNEAMITGESKPVDKKVSSTVIAGTVNESGSLTISVTEVGEKTALAGIMRLVAEAQSSKSKSQILADKAAFALTIIAIIAGGLSLFGWIWAGETTQFAVERMVTVLVIACPHALGLAVPLVTAISTSLAARNGLLIRQRMALESARNVDVILFDKTGTLTEGNQAVDHVFPVDDHEVDEILGLAAAIENASEHSIGRAIVKAAKDKKLTPPQATEFSALKGKGVRATVAGQQYYAGGTRMLEEIDAQLPDDIASQLRETAQTVVYLLRDKKVIGAITITDRVRPESTEAVKALQALGKRVVMLTGDSEAVAKEVARDLGIKEYFAEVLPEHKVDKVKELQKDGSRVAMVGDGVNDAPALTQADIGIAIGAGTDVAIESAGIILVKNDPRDVVKVIRLSQSTYGKMVQNLIWATGYNVVAIPLAAGVLASMGIILSPAVGAVLMSVSTVVVAFNAQLLRKLRLEKEVA